MVWVRALAAWVMIVLVESVHGMIRRLVVEPVAGDLTARRIAFFSGMLLIMLVGLLTVGWIGARSFRQLWAIGIAWAALMLSFELGLGIALGYSRERILEDYDPSRGGLMVFGIGFMAIVPTLTAKIRGVRLNEQG